MLKGILVGSPLITEMYDVMRDPSWISINYCNV